MYHTQQYDQGIGMPEQSSMYKQWLQVIRNIYLVFKGIRNDKTWVANCTTQVHQTYLCKKKDATVGVKEHPPINMRLDGNLLNTRESFKA